MRRSIRTLLVSVVLVLVACAAAPASTHKPHLRLASMQPMEVYGYRFAPHERVRVTVTTGAGRWTRQVRTGRHGRFHATFPAEAHAPCGGFRVRAVGHSGRRAVLRHMMLPACMAL